jgi:predicted metal-dependent phosphotriesterase family hydrolase
MLDAYGGWGYDHILKHIVPMMRDEGILRPAIDAILIESPRRLLVLQPQMNEKGSPVPHRPTLSAP